MSHQLTQLSEVNAEMLAQYRVPNPRYDGHSYIVVARWGSEYVCWFANKKGHVSTGRYCDTLRQALRVFQERVAHCTR